MWALCLVVLLAAGCAEHSARPPRPAEEPPATGVRFTATAYCTGTVTATGLRPNETTIAADPRVLPMGSKVRVSGLHKHYNRVYTSATPVGAFVDAASISTYPTAGRPDFGRRSARVAIIQ